MSLSRLASIDDVFAHHLNTAGTFWKRFGGQPDLKNKRVMDFGCGVGGLLQNVMTAGAKEGVGIDISEKAIGYAKQRLEREWGDRVDIRLGDVRTEQIDEVDVIVSQNTLEHVQPLKETIDAVVAKCKTGGEIYLSFSPLWHSPYGNHNYPPSPIPWLHLIYGDRIVLKAFKDIAKKDYASVFDAGFNKATPAEFKSLFASLPVRIVSCQTNVGDTPRKEVLMSVARVLAKLPGLEKYFIFGFTIHMKKL